ncbi:MAG: hypothetical protein JKX95_07790, partial [Bacteroidia bacterium]|nr:hypothetical protein [Bacteroidia bacterium]
YAIEEHFTKELLERNSRNDGFFVRFSDEFYWQNENYSFYESDMKIYNEKKISKEIVSNGVSRLEQFRRGILTASEVFDINKLAKWHSISAVLGAQHSLLWFNSVFYFNPNSNLFEPVCYDGNAGKAEDNLALNNYKYKHDPYLNILFSDLTYMEKYVNYLEFYSDKIYFENFLKTVSNELEIKIKEIHSDHLYFTYDSEVFNNNINMIKKQLKPLKALNSYYIKENDNTKILLGSLISLPTLLDKLLFQNNSIYDFENEVLKGKKDHNKIEYKAFDLPLGTIKLSKKENLFLTFQILGCSKLCTTKVVKYNSDYSVLFN